jgi:hypothetical protein
MYIDTEINLYLSKLSVEKKVLLLELIKKLNNTSSDFSVAEKILVYNNELEQAVQKIQSGDFLEHKDVLKEADGW